MTTAFEVQVQSLILTVGLNHTTAPIAVRERVAVQPCLRDQAQDSLLERIDPTLFPEVLVLSTCNRTEIYAVTADCRRGEQIIRQVFGAHDDFSCANPDYCYAYGDRAAASHLFAVASGIDSMLLGEFEILRQIRQAFQTAANKQRTGPILHQLFQQAITAGKRARSETGIGAGATSVAYAAVALARQQLGSLKGRTALVIGAGEMGRRAARNLVQDGACAALVASRNYAHAAELAARVACRAIPFHELAGALAQIDLVISATKAPHLILTAPQIASAMKLRPGRPLCLMDIAVPRDIDPEAKGLENVSLFNIDDLREGAVQRRRCRAPKPHLKCAARPGWGAL